MSGHQVGQGGAAVTGVGHSGQVGCDGWSTMGVAGTWTSQSRGAVWAWHNGLVGLASGVMGVAQWEWVTIRLVGMAH